MTNIEFTLAFIATVVLVFVASAIVSIIVRGGKGQRIHWNAKEGQIMNKAGECLYDRRRASNDHSTLAHMGIGIDGMGETVKSQREQIDRLIIEKGYHEAQLKCQAKTGHKMLFEKNLESLYDRWHIFKCKHCGLEITKTEKELKPAEKEALKKLGIL